MAILHWLTETCKRHGNAPCAYPKHGLVRSETQPPGILHELFAAQLESRPNPTLRAIALFLVYSPNTLTLDPATPRIAGLPLTQVAERFRVRLYPCIFGQELRWSVLVLTQYFACVAESFQVL